MKEALAVFWVGCFCLGLVVGHYIGTNPGLWWLLPASVMFDVLAYLVLKRLGVFGKW